MKSKEKNLCPQCLADLDECGVHLCKIPDLLERIKIKADQRRYQHLQTIHNSVQ